MLNDALSVSPVPATNVKVNVVLSSTSVPLKLPIVAFAPAFSAMDVALRAISVGASLTALTVNTNVSVVVNVPSLTVTVIVADPDKFVAGVTVTVRFAPEPPNTMFAFGINVVSLELPLTVKEVVAVSASPTVNEIALVAVSSFVD